MMGVCRERRHLDVEQDDGEVTLEQDVQRLLSRLRAHHPNAQRGQHRLHRQQVGVVVVDDQDVAREDALVFAFHLGSPRRHQWDRPRVANSPAADG